VYLKHNMNPYFDPVATVTFSFVDVALCSLRHMRSPPSPPRPSRGYPSAALSTNALPIGLMPRARRPGNSRVPTKSAQARNQRPWVLSWVERHGPATTAEESADVAASGVPDRVVSSNPVGHATIHTRSTTVHRKAPMLFPPRLIVPAPPPHTKLRRWPAGQRIPKIGRAHV